jgi:hypothetical protein
MSRGDVISWFGDKNPIAHGGGYIFDGGDDEPFIQYTPGLTDREAILRGKILVYTVDVPNDVWRYHNWAKPLDMASRSGPTLGELRRWGKSRDISDRVTCLWLIGDHYGWENLDDSPDRYAPQELAEQWSE